MAYIEFANGGAINNALELDGSEVGGFMLNVQEAKPRGDSSGGGGRGFGRDGCRRGGGRDGGRRGGGRFGSGVRGGGRFGSGGRGRGTPNKPSFTPSGNVIVSDFLLFRVSTLKKMLRLFVPGLLSCGRTFLCF